MTWQQHRPERGEEDYQAKADEVFKVTHQIIGAINKHLEESPPCEHNLRFILSEAFDQQC
jgi:hypothetical protein